MLGKVKKGLARMKMAIVAIILLVIAFIVWIVGATSMVVYAPMP